MRILDREPVGAFWALPGEHATLSLDRVVDYPVLSQCLEDWRALVAHGLPSDVDPRGRRWSYVRLFLPFSRAGDGVDRFVTVIDPGSFGRVQPDDQETDR